MGNLLLGAYSPSKQTHEGVAIILAPVFLSAATEAQREKRLSQSTAGEQQNRDVNPNLLF